MRKKKKDEFEPEFEPILIRKNLRQSIRLQPEFDPEVSKPGSQNNYKIHPVRPDDWEEE